MERVLYFKYQVGIGIIDNLGNFYFFVQKKDAIKIFEFFSKLVSNIKISNKNEYYKKANFLFKIWIKKNKKININNNNNNVNNKLDFSKLIVSDTHIFVNKKNIDWKKIIKKFNNFGLTIEEKLESNIDSNFKYPLKIFLVKNKNGVVFGGGKGINEKSAKCSAIAETVERLISQLPKKNSIINSEVKLLKKKLNFELYSRDVYSNQIVLEWIEAYNLSKNEETFFPLELAYFNVSKYKTGLKLFSNQHTTGLSCGSSVEEAVINGILEVLERDTYWITMRCRINLPDIKIKEITNMSKKIFKIISYFENNNYKVIIKDMSLDWKIPIVHITLENKIEKMPAFIHSSGAGFTWEMAINRALCEAIQMYNDMSLVVKLKKNQINSSQKILGNSKLAWCDPLIREHLLHLISPNSKKKWRKNIKLNSIEELIKKVTKKNHEIIFINLGSFHKLQVVRVIVSNTVQSSHRLEKIGERLKKYGLKEKLKKGFYSDPILT